LQSLGTLETIDQCPEEDRRRVTHMDAELTLEEAIAEFQSRKPTSALERAFN
jgi:hypothetical protein